MTQQIHANLRTVDIPAKIQTGNHQNGTINYYHCTNQLKGRVA